MHREGQELDPVWDCTLISRMRNKKETNVNPIYEWTDADVWEYARVYGVKMNPLYEQGFKRVGCIGCPLAGVKKQKNDFRRWPTYYDAYIRAFDAMVKAPDFKKRYKTESWDCGEDVMKWWLREPDKMPGQMTIEDWEKMMKGKDTENDK